MDNEDKLTLALDSLADEYEQLKEVARRVLKLLDKASAYRARAATMTKTMDILYAYEASTRMTKAARSSLAVAMAKIDQESQ